MVDETFTTTMCTESVNNVGNAVLTDFSKTFDLIDYATPNPRELQQVLVEFNHNKRSITLLSVKSANHETDTSP